MLLCQSTPCSLSEEEKEGKLDTALKGELVLDSGD
jgi:hypothetical protein